MLFGRVCLKGLTSILLDSLPTVSRNLKDRRIMPLTGSVHHSGNPRDNVHFIVSVVSVEILFSIEIMN